ncbi:acetyltransferase (GNAT) family protein [Luteimonas cucumeris]|uniref:Acetyltransferase (GNAT) family protein n=1 Tax=Luteimonas cucumeris TaxID=985012 RepID=A0A562LEY2_9GAMM|nr:GNAT family N-acetyltransferase [Luteimonas cucumeris]TWI06168.1 acetyltransferase (GNAT) family protein [Luteimonas cucumeris]
MDEALAVNFQPWRPADRDAGLALFDSNVPKYFAEQERQDFLDHVDVLPGPYFLLMDAGDSPVGCGGYAREKDRPGSAALCWGMIRGDRHGQGLGDALLRFRLDQIAVDPAFHEVRIETSQFSRGFFARYGFVPTRQVVDGFAPGIDLIAMTLDLAAYRARRT